MSPSPVLDSERKSVLALRDALNVQLPPEFDNDLYLLKWVRGWEGNLKEILPRLTTFIRNRHLLQFDTADFVETHRRYSTELHKHNAPFYSGSVSYNVNLKDGRDVIWIDRTGLVDTKNVVKVAKFSDFLKFVTMSCEAVQRSVLALEKEVGEPCGVIYIYDMAGLSVNALIANYTNGALKEASRSLLDNYPELMTKILVINQPPVIDFLYGLVKRFLPLRTAQKVTFLSMQHWKSEILEYVDPRSLPQAYVGTLVDIPARCDPYTGCTPDPRPITPEDFYRSRIGRFELSVHYLKPKGVLKFECAVDSANTHKLEWCFQANGVVVFSIWFAEQLDNDNIEEAIEMGESPSGSDSTSPAAMETSEGELIYPKLPVFTGYLPEDGNQICAKPGRYIVEFLNVSSVFFSTKLEVAINLVELANNNITKKIV